MLAYSRRFGSCWSEARSYVAVDGVSVLDFPKGCPRTVIIVDGQKSCSPNGSSADCRPGPAKWRMALQAVAGRQRTAPARAARLLESGASLLFSYDGMNLPLATTESWGRGRLYSTLLSAAVGASLLAARGSKQGRCHGGRSRVQKLLQHRQDQFSIVIRKRHVASCAPKAIIQGLSTDVSSPSCFRDMLPDASVGVPGCTIWHLHPRLPRPLTQQQLQSPMM